MPAFARSPRFIIGTIVALWVVYVLWANFRLDPVTVHLLPYMALEIKVSAVIIGAAIFGSAATLVIQWLWRRRSSKNAAQSAMGSGVSARTVA